MSEQGEGRTVNEAIMQATYRALGKHGYPATSINRIADEFEKSKSLLYYHYEDKEDLFEDFLRYLLDRYETKLKADTDEEPRDHLVDIVDRMIPPDMDDEELRFRRAILEMRSQAPYNEVYHEQFKRSDDLALSELATTIERGIESGAFRAVNSKETADFIYSMVYGALERGVTLDDPEVIRRSRDAIVNYIESQLVKFS